MAILNTASVLFDGATITSNQTTTDIDQPLTLVKSVDKLNALPGQTLTYSIVVNNPNDYAVSGISFMDSYDSTQTTYVADSFTFENASATPTIVDPIAYTIATIPALTSVTITFQVTVGTN